MIFERINAFLNNHVFIKRGFRYLGKGCHIGKKSYFQNKHNISIDEETQILDYARLQSYSHLTKIPGEIIIGKRCYIGFYFSALAGSNIVIEDNVLIASHVIITSENHSIDPENSLYYMDQPLQCRPVKIKEGSWIGEKAIILPGVEIGKKCIIGAGSVVTKSIPDYSIAVGNPAKVIKKYNFSKHTWEKLK
ncbi:acyltransferase [[Clostridium] spiroforme]|nr:acyltransferase [Thomasclavelia spiroformis]